MDSDLAKKLSWSILMAKNFNMDTTQNIMRSLLSHQENTIFLTYETDSIYPNVKTRKPILTA